MAVEIEFTNEFGEWWNDLSVDEQDGMRDGVELLRRYDEHLVELRKEGLI